MKVWKLYVGKWITSENLFLCQLNEKRSSSKEDDLLVNIKVKQGGTPDLW